MRALFLAPVVVAMLIGPALAAGRIPYGSRIGMEVTVTSVEGIGTTNAVIRVRHTRENAKEFCVDYSNDQSEDCVKQTLRDVRINDELHGNCKTGVFTTLYGDKLRFMGINRRKSDIAPKYIISGSDGPLSASTASGYYIALAQFNSLCPGAAGEDP